VVAVAANKNSWTAAVAVAVAFLHPWHPWEAVAAQDSLGFQGGHSYHDHFDLPCRHHVENGLVYFGHQNDRAIVLCRDCGYTNLFLDYCHDNYDHHESETD